MTNQEHLQFGVVKSLVDQEMANQKVHIYTKDIDRMVSNAGIRAKVLSDLLVKELKEHNSAIESKRTKLRNLRYKDHTTYRSKLIVGHNVPFNKIKQLIKDHPEADSYDIYKMLNPNNY